MEFEAQLKAIIGGPGRIKNNPERRHLIQDAVDGGEAIVAGCGALATWTPVESTGRSPKDTLLVKRPVSQDTIDWDSPNNIPVDPDTIDMALDDALEVLASKKMLYVLDRVVGADPSYTLPLRTVTDKALHALFADNMFRPVPEDIEKSCFHDRPFTLIALPYDKLDHERFDGRLRVDPTLGHTSTMIIAMDVDRRIGLVYGSAYCGSLKKLIFTVMNYILPAEGILPIHCSANEGPDGDTALLLGLSGTGKTTLSADPRRALLGDDEHGWNDDGIANFENGCYAKLINLDPAKEPEIFYACFHVAPFLEHGAIIENAMMYPDGHFDLDDERYTPNSRGSYPLTYLSNFKAVPVGGHPKTILFLTADANGVLPPVSRLTTEQAMLWFLMGYTSKLAGTERGVVDPRTTFSRFFGGPFMSRNPDVYASLLGQKLEKHGSKVYLVNTGWTAGPFGIGHRMDITLTREIVQCALTGKLDDLEYDHDPYFKVLVPRSCPGVPDASILNPKNTWNDPANYEARARKLAGEFAAHFEKAYGSKGIDEAIAAECPGR